MPPSAALAGDYIHPHLVLQGDKVKSGQVLGYVEQLGTFVPIEVGCTPSVSVQRFVGRGSAWAACFSCTCPSQLHGGQM